MFRFWRKQPVNIDPNVISEEINRSKRFGHSFGLIILEHSHSGAKGLGKFIPGKTISYQILKSHLRCYDKVIGHSSDATVCCCLKRQKMVWRQ